MELTVIVAVAGLLVGWFAGARLGLGASSQPDPHTEPLRRLAEDLRDGRLATVDNAEPPEVKSVREALSAAWVPRNEKSEEALRQAFGRVAAFVEHSVEQPLQKVRDGDADLLREGVDRALGGLQDIKFYLREPLTPDETHNLTPLLQQVTRQFIADWETAVRFMAPAEPVRARIHRDSFLDAVYLLLHNAGHFGDGKTVDVSVEPGTGSEVRVTIRDRGPGFTPEALQRAHDLFYTTRPGALGLGIPFARKVAEGLGGRLEIENDPQGGARVQLILPAG
jgi:signal transduction histidine kinase